MLSDSLLVALAILLGLLALISLFFLLRRRIESRRQLVRQVEELEALGRVGRALVEAELDPAALYELIYKQAGTIIDTSTFQLGLLENGRYHIVIWVRENQRLEPSTFELDEGEGLVGWVADHKAPLLVGDYQSEWESLPAHPRYVDHKPARSALFIPLITGDECIGVLAAQSFIPHAFSQDDLRRLSIVANQAASAIANARLYQQSQTRVAQLELVSRVSRQVRALTPLQDLFQQTVDLVQDTFGYYCVSIYDLDVTTGLLALQATTVDALIERHREIASEEGLIHWAVANKQAVLVNDVSADPRYLSLSSLPDTRAEIVAPLIIEEQVIGALDVQSDRLNAFGGEDLFALEALADQIALAIQESRLYQAERQQRSIAETLREVAQTLTSSLELETVLNAILTDLRRVLVYDAASILLLEREDRVVIRAAQGLPSVAATQGQQFRLADSRRLQALAQSDRPIIFQSDDPWGSFHALLGLPLEHACLGAPLVARDELIGFLTVDALPPQSYQPADIAVISAFAGQAAVAIDNARLFASQREEAWIASALLQMAEATAQFTEMDQVLGAIVQMTLLLIGVDRCGILLWNEERKGFQGTQLAGEEADPLLLDEFSQMFLPSGAWGPLAALAEVSGEMAEKERPLPIILGGGEVLSELPDELFDIFGLDAWLLLLPLLGKGKLIGVMLVSGSASDVDLMRRRVRLIGGIANQAAMAIENAQLYVAQQEEAFVTIALLQVAEAVNSLTNLNEILDTIVRLSPMLAGVEACVLLYWHAERGVFSMGPEYGMDPDKELLFQQSLADPSVLAFLDALQLAREPIGVGMENSIAMPPAWHQIMDSHSMLALPLITRRELMGALLVSIPAGDLPLSARRQNILTGIAHQASIAIENDQLYGEAVERERMDRELEVAREIQSSFLPDSHPEAPGWSIGTFWQAARQVGGDFYDFFLLDRTELGERWGVVIADVADKGVPAALYMALSRTLIRTVGHSRVDPASSLERVNDLLLADSRSGLFVTVIYAVWEPGKNSLTYTNAGHNPPLWLRSDGDIEVLRSNNIVLGVLPEVTMDQQTVNLGPGEAMVLYTDGITDAINERQEEFGLDRLEAVVYASRAAPAAQMVQAIEEALAAFVGQAPQFDDLTLVVIKRERA